VVRRRDRAAAAEKRVDLGHAVAGFKLVFNQCIGAHTPFENPEGVS
jgi:hypothetical protein